MAKRVTLTKQDLQVIKALLHDEYTAREEGLATPAELCEIITPIFKIEALLEKAAK
jgi:hypothetical protein